MNNKLLCASMLMATLALSACGGGDDSPAPAPTPTPSPSPVSAATALALDTQFGNQGSTQLQLAPFGGALSHVLELPDGKLLLLGNRQLEASSVTVEGSPDRVAKRPSTTLFARRLLANGQPDLSYGKQGLVEWQVAGSDRMGDAMALPDGSVMLTVLGGEPCFWQQRGISAVCLLSLPDGPFADDPLPRLQRLLPDGSLDRSGRAEGHYTLSGWDTRLAQQGDHVLVLSSAPPSRARIFNWTLTRHAFNTQLDTSFATQGKYNSRCRTDGANVQVDASKSIWVAGALTTASFSPVLDSFGLCMERLNANGSVHASMPQPLAIPLGLNLSTVAMRVLPDQRVLVAGKGASDTQQQNYAVSINPNGQLSSGYGQQGVARFTVPAESVTPWYYSAEARIASTGEVLHIGAAGWTEEGAANEYRQHPLSTRFTPQGQLDTSWGQAGLLREALPGTVKLVDSQKRWLTVSSDAAAADKPSTFTVTRLRGGF